MKYTLHAFTTINSMIDNSRFQDSPIGELSAVARTYAKDKTYYTLDAYPDVRLISFRSMTDDTDHVEVPLKVRELCIKLGAWLEQRAQNNQISSDNNVNRQAILAEFSDEIKSLELGRAVMVKNRYLPQYVEFKLVDETTYSDSLIKIWYADQAFKTQYPYYDLVVIPLVEDLDMFFGNYTQVRDIKEKIDVKVIHDEANRLRDKSPYTLINTDNYTYHPYNEGDAKIEFPWTVLVYGGVGDNKDIIRKELENYILTHSKQPRSEWEKIFPDIFVPTEYVFAPFWTINSIPGYRTISAFYGPTLKHNKILPFCKEAIDYDSAHLEEHLEISGSLYKSLSFAVVGNPKNRLLPVSFYEAYPQYALIASRTDDFNRMDTKHQDLVEVLNKLFVWSEMYNEDVELPLDLGKVERNGVIYISTTHNNVQYLMIAKMNYTNGTLVGELR